MLAMAFFENACHIDPEQRSSRPPQHKDVVNTRTSVSRSATTARIAQLKFAYRASRHMCDYEIRAFVFSECSTKIRCHFLIRWRPMSIRVNIAKQVRQTMVLAWRPLLPLFEAVMNSFQAIKEAKPPSHVPGCITIEVVRKGPQLDLDVPPISGFRVIDNGIGLDDSNYDSFNTAFSPHKLSRGGKGLGRFTWLKAFEHAKIESTFKDEDGLQTRSFTFDENYDMDDKRGLPKPATQSHTGTTIELVELKRLYHDQCPRSTEVFIQKLIEHFILVLLDKDCPEVTVIDLGHRHNINDIFEREYKASASSHSFDINACPFTLHGFRHPEPVPDRAREYEPHRLRLRRS